MLLCAGRGASRPACRQWWAGCFLERVQVDGGGSRAPSPRDPERGSRGDGADPRGRRLCFLQEDDGEAEHGARARGDEDARLAQREGVSILSVGSELSSLEQELGRWRALITQIRTEYSGSLIYSANWDHFQHVPFWALLDYVGISGYFELTKDSKATSEELTNAWWKIRTVILDWLSQYTRPLIFTELGYPSRDGGAVYPWDYTRKAVIDLEEQRRALAAFKAVWATEERLHGVYFWNWWGPDDGRNSWYTIPGKPGLSEVVEYFRLRSLR